MRLTLLSLAALLFAAAPAWAQSVHPHRTASGTRGQRSHSSTSVVGELTDSRAAAGVGPYAEDRPDNDPDNGREPTAAQLRSFRAHDTSMPAAYLDRIDGRYRGTTSQIIEWAALKWGLDPDLLRAVASVESWWHMYTVGDGGYAYGLFQIDVRYHADQQLAENDSAFNADYYGAIIRSYYDGSQTWLNTVSGNGARYSAHNLWGSVGYWAGGRWETSTGDSYDAQVQSDLSEQVWLQPNFDGR